MSQKALFRALKTKGPTPKYGILFSASVVGQAAVKHKGKMSRVLAAKTSLAARVDALADEPQVEIGLEYRALVDARLRQLEGDQSHRAVGAKVASGPSAYTPAKAVQYNDDADVAIDSDGDVNMGDAKAEKKKKKKDKKEKKDKKDKKEKKKDKKRKASDDDDDAPAKKSKSKHT